MYSHEIQQTIFGQAISFILTVPEEIGEVIYSANKYRTLKRAITNTLIS